MGYTVSFFSMNLSNLAMALRGEQRDRLRRHIIQGAGGKLFASAAGRGLDCEAALADLLGGTLGSALVSRPAQSPAEPQDASDAVAIAFLALIQTLGVPAGELIHNSAAGPMFRDHFLDQTLPSVLAPFDWYLLVDRPMFGLTHPGYPTWGGLGQQECQTLWQGHSLDTLPELEDSDEEEWLYSIGEALTVANAHGTGLLTLYY